MELTTAAQEFSSNNTPTAKAAQKAMIHNMVVDAPQLSNDTSDYSEQDMHQYEEMGEGMETMTYDSGQINALKVDHNVMQCTECNQQDDHHPIIDIVDQITKEPTTQQQSERLTTDTINQLQAPELINFPPMPSFLASNQILHSTDMDSMKMDDDETVATENTSTDSRGFIQLLNYNNESQSDTGAN